MKLRFSGVCVVEDQWYFVDIYLTDLVQFLDADLGPAPSGDWTNIAEKILIALKDPSQTIQGENASYRISDDLQGKLIERFGVKCSSKQEAARKFQAVVAQASRN
jgi:hypothetical protein